MTYDTEIGQNGEQNIQIVRDEGTLTPRLTDDARAELVQNVINGAD